MIDQRGWGCGAGRCAPTIHASIASFRATSALIAKGLSSDLVAEFTGVSATVDRGTSSGNVTIVGPGATKLTISGVDHHRLFFVNGGARTMSGVMLTHGLGAGGHGGSTPGAGGGGGAAGVGGAMFINAGTVTLKDLVVSENAAQDADTTTSDNADVYLTP